MGVHHEKKVDFVVEFCHSSFRGGVVRLDDHCLDDRRDLLPDAARFVWPGKRVFTAMNREVKAGEHRIVWNGRNERGQAVASGIYMVKMTIGDFSLTRKMTLLR